MQANVRKIILLILDIVLVNLCIYVALVFRFDGNIPAEFINIYFDSIIYLTLIKITIYYLFGLYKSLWRYASIDEMLQLAFAVAIEGILTFLFGHFFNLRLPRTVYAIACILTFLTLGGVRLSYRISRRVKNIVVKDKDNVSHIMVIGAGDAGSMVIRELQKHSELKGIPVAVIDDDIKKHGSRIHGVPIVGGRESIKDAAVKNSIDEIIVALPSVPKGDLRNILKICQETKCKLKTLPGMYELINEDVSIKSIRDVNIEDLLGRDEVDLNIKEISGYIKNEVVLVTGGGGSIGSELCRQIARFHPKKLLILDIYENNAYDLQQELERNFKNKLNMEVVIASVRDKARMERIFDLYRPGVVFHAAAHKHVPLMEVNPEEAIKNNIKGTLNTAQCADKYGSKRFVLISTDKAVNPTNIMGASKRAAEMVVQALNKHSKTKFTAVRFGNVLGSNGSVIPLFKKQIESGGPVTVTHPEITRYFMTIPEAAKLVIQAGAMAKGGEIFILDMGESVKIVDLARDLIKLSGFEPDTDIKIEFTGLRPGEKLYEELLLAEEGVKSTRHKSIFIAKPLEIDFDDLMVKIAELEDSLDNTRKIKECLGRIVLTYHIGNDEAAVTK
jgi:FlaA1/EpsC-like NDP-sugar epimerase